MPPKECQTVNLIVIGQKGSGKSSLVNTFKTVLRNSGQLSTIAATYVLAQTAPTTKLSEVTLKRFSQGEKLRIFDCRGVTRLPPYSAAFQGNLMKTISGHIKKGYELMESTRTIREDDEFYKLNPTISDKMHCVLFVINVDFIVGGDHELLKSVQRDLQLMNIPIRVILTRADKLCHPSNMDGIFRNEKVYKAVEEAKRMFHVHDCQVLPIANYVQGTTQNITQDVLALLAINNIVQEAISYIENEI